jgi:hypothetical protein
LPGTAYSLKKSAFGTPQEVATISKINAPHRNRCVYSYVFGNQQKTRLTIGIQLPFALDIPYFPILLVKAWRPATTSKTGRYRKARRVGKVKTTDELCQSM